MKLKQLFENIDHTLRSISPDKQIHGLACDSRKVRRGDLFIAIKGEECDGHDFVPDAMGRGAAAVCVQRRNPDWGVIPAVLVEDTAKMCASAAARFYGYPADRLKIIGITGTNGKTTTAYIIYSVLNTVFGGSERKCGVAPLGHFSINFPLTLWRKVSHFADDGTSPEIRAGLIGTVGHRIGPRTIAAGNTTPGPLETQWLFKEMADRGMAYAVMEVSSHALKQGRTAAIGFKAVVMTNVTGDHLDYHGTMRDYADSKRMIFSSLEADGLAVLNRDDEWYEHMRAAAGANVVTYSIKEQADVTAADIVMDTEGTRFVLNAEGSKAVVRTPLIGRHNVYNILAAVCALRAEGLTPGDIAAALKGLGGPQGRLETIRCGQPFPVIVDYAHTADALRRLLEAVHEVFSVRPACRSEKGAGRLVLVFGCGGERDRTKRPEMGAVAAAYADEVIITSDNPRTEDPDSIIEDIASGIPREFTDFVKITDRRDAIAMAIEGRKAADVVVIAGKGHEDHQIVGKERLPFDDGRVVREMISAYAAGEVHGR